MDRRGIETEDIRWYLGHNDTDTTRSYILNNQGKKKTAKRIIDALSEMNESDVLMGTQNSRERKIARSLLK
jgi:hypothetical protein